MPKVDMPIFADWRQNWLAQQRTLSDRKKKDGLIMPAHMSTYPENLVKIGPVRSPKRPIKKKVTLSAHLIVVHHTSGRPVR